MDFSIKKGYDLPLAGKPATEVEDVAPSATVAVYPLEFTGVRQRLLVREGERVQRGTAVLEDKANTAFKLCAPAGGTVRHIRRGMRRFVEEIVIAVDDASEPVTFASFAAGELASLDRNTVLDQLVATGYLALIEQRPFGRMADPEARPKTIFVNAMNTAPFQADAEAVAATDPKGFQAGLDVLHSLTDGDVHLCMGANAGDVLRGAVRVLHHRFTGPHPAGNSSIHIDRIDPMQPTDIVWTVKAVDLVRIGRLFLDGVLPASRVLALGGPSVKPEAQRHFRIRMGGALTPLLKDALRDEAVRVIAGDVLSGSEIPVQTHARFRSSAVTAVPVDRERLFMGWTTPGLKQFSMTRLFLSRWLPKRPWRLGTNMHGEPRALVVTGHYDKVMPLNIMVDMLVRAAMAGDTDEAIALGILETLPEDFGLCDVICPSKIEVQNLMRRCLQQIEEEGI